MANSKLLKEAIADAKAVKETALANAKLALEEAFTPRLQSVLAAKLQAEAEDEEKDAEKVDEELDSSNIGSSTSNPKLDAHTEFEGGSTETTSGEPGAQVADFKKVADINEEDGMEMGDDEKAKQDEIAQLKARLAELEGEDSEEENPFAKAEGEEEMGSDDEFNFDSEEGDDSMEMDSDDEESEDDMDLEAIIRELEAQLSEEDNSDDEKEKGMYEEEESDEKKEKADESYSDGSDAGTDKGEDPKVVTNEEENEKDDEEKNEVIDLEEILREMEKDMKGDDKEDEKKDESLQAELNEAYNTIKSLQKTINEVNLLNAKLLFANKLFRAHNMTNEQKVKVIETLDRTNSVREVKLVYATLAENFRYSTPTQKSVKKSITEGIASKVVKSTAPKAEEKQVIAESANFADRFKKLAGIIK